jgi:hypothetical protein
VAVTREALAAGGRFQLYIDGEPVATTGDALGAMPDASPASLWIGAAEAIAPFKGWLDEVSIYRTALTAADVRAIAVAGEMGKCTQFTSSITWGDQTGGPASEDVGVELRGAAGWTPRPGTESQVTYDWSFGDGRIGSGAVVSHSFAEPGQYTVTLVVIDADGNRSESSTTVPVVGVYAPQPAGLVGWWRAEGDARDQSAGGHHGAFVGTAQYAPGKVGQAFRLDGTNYVRVDDAPAWRFGSGAFTVELWAKLDPAQDPNNAVFVAHDTTSASNKWIFWLWTDGVNNVLRDTPAVRLHVAEFPSSGFRPYDVAAAPWAPGPNEWHHVAVTREALAAGRPVPALHRWRASCHDGGRAGRHARREPGVAVDRCRRGDRPLQGLARRGQHLPACTYRRGKSAPSRTQAWARFRQ